MVSCDQQVPGCMLVLNDLSLLSYISGFKHILSFASGLPTGLPEDALSCHEHIPSVQKGAQSQFCGSLSGAAMPRSLFASEQLDFSTSKVPLAAAPGPHAVGEHSAFGRKWSGSTQIYFFFLPPSKEGKEEGEFPVKRKMKLCQNQPFSLLLLLPAPTPSPLFSGCFLLWPQPGRSRQCQGPKDPAVPATCALFPGGAIRLCPIHSCSPP